MPLTVEGGFRVEDWELKAEQSRAAVTAEWEAMQLTELIGEVRQAWGRGEVLSPESNTVAIAHPNLGIVDVHGALMHQVLETHDADGQLKSQFTLNLTYTPSNMHAPFALWVEDTERYPMDDHALSAGRMGVVSEVRGLDTDYTREILYHPSHREGVRGIIRSHIGMALRVRQDKGFLAPVPISTSAGRRVA